MGYGKNWEKIMSDLTTIGKGIDRIVKQRDALLAALQRIIGKAINVLNALNEVNRRKLIDEIADIAEQAIADSK